jgi:hypothetical protein
VIFMRNKYISFAENEKKEETEEILEQNIYK